MRLLAHDLELIDAEHVRACLESSSPANNQRYASGGQSFPSTTSILRH